MSYLPLTDGEREEMLASMGYSSIDELFSAAGLLGKVELGLGEAKSEAEVTSYMKELAEEVQTDVLSFVGAGAYPHFIPSVIAHITSRGEFYTAYTPYQAELSQGTLQSIYEYQSMICQLSAMAVTNASMYDGASALGEAALLAMRTTHRNRLLVSASLHPRWREVLATYVSGIEAQLVEIPFDEKKGTVDISAVEREAEEGAALIIQNPNFFGVIEEEAPKLGEIIQLAKGQFIVCADPISLGIIEAPGNYGADIYVAEGQGLGSPLSYGGPYLGIMAARKGLERSLPGRIVGRTNDAEGKVGYVLTLQTREQHIRRQKATSNICTNQALVALAAAVFLSLLGKNGIHELATQNLAKAEYAKRELVKRGLKVVFSGATFNEFLVGFSVSAREVYKSCVEEGVVPGMYIDQWYPQFKKNLLICVTERHSKAEIDRLVELLGRWGG